jgi:DNA replication protein DnaC
MVLELVRSEFLLRRENVLPGNSGTAKMHIALALGLAACQHDYCVRFTTASALVQRTNRGPATRRSCSASRSRLPATICSSSMN